MDALKSSPWPAVAAGFALLCSMPVLLLRQLAASVGLAPPTAKQRKEEDTTACALFRALPELASCLAWRSLGALPATPVHTCTMWHEGSEISFHVKREDLVSPYYGGNKVRTLQHQLAVCEAKIERAAPADKARLENLDVLGTGGSNQVVATAVHGARLGLTKLHMLWMAPDLPDLDNTLNMLSALSLRLDGRRLTWGSPLAALRQLLATLLGGGVVLPMGGNNISGVLGQMSGALELAEQIEAGEAPDPDSIYLAVGSSCTISGLVLGVALSRALGRRAFTSRRFRIVGVIIHHAVAAAQRRLGFSTGAAFRHFPLTLQHSVRTAAAALAQLGGPDVLESALRMLRMEVRLETSPELVGVYGGHSAPSRAAAAAYEESAAVVDPSGGSAPHLWLCGHFAAKPFAAMLRDLRTAADAGEPLCALHWQTKSATQPRGEADEWAAMRAMPGKVRAWADKGEAESAFRFGKVDTTREKVDVTSAGYRHLMTKLPRGGVGAGGDGEAGSARSPPRPRPLPTPSRGHVHVAVARRR